MRVPNDFPPEIAPLVVEINALLEHSERQAEEARTHAGNLAHALKTPMSVLTNEAVAKAADLPEALTVLSRFEPVLAAIERSLGMALAPNGLGAAPEIGFDLSVRDGEGAGAYALRLALDPEVGLAWPVPSEPPMIDGEAASTPLACRLVIEGPLAPQAELCRLEVGDMVLLPSGPRRASLSPGLGAAASGIYDAPSRRLTIEALDREERPPPDEASDGTVRLTLAGPEASFPLGELAALRPGSVLAAPWDEDDAFEVMAEGRTIALGRLVAVGQAHGVLIDSLAQV